jgi:hypothetical protein
VSASFRSNGTFSGTSTFSGMLDVQVPAACFGGGSSCADLDAALANAAGPGAGIVATACTGSDPCACTITEGGTSNVAGTYTTSGSILMTTPAGGDPTQTPYCVSGSYLHFLNLVASKVTSDAVLARR